MPWLDDLLGKTVLANGAPLPDRKLLNFRSGVDVQVADNPTLQSTDVSIFGASYVRAFGAVVGAVNIGSGEDVNPLRAPVLTDGDYSAYPFQHLGPAIAALPLHLGGFTLRLNASAGTFPGVNLGGFIGGPLQLCGTWATPTIGSGVTSGTAGAGSAGNAVNKPTAAPNWPNDGSLVGLKLLVTGGAGFTGADAMTETVVTIKSHTATQLILQSAVPSLGPTTTFALVTEGTIINTAAPIAIDGKTCLLGVDYCHAKIQLRRIKLDNAGSPAPYALITSGTRVVDLGGCNVHGDWLGEEVDRFELNAVTIGGQATLTDCGKLNGSAYLPAAGRIVAEAFQEITLYAAAIGCTGSAVRVLHSGYLGHEIDANNCTAPPLEMVDVQYSEPIGNGLTGANPGAAFAASVQAGGKHVFTGSTMTAIADLDFDAFPVSWAQLAASNYFSPGTYAYWTDNIWVQLGKFFITNNSSQDFDDLVTRDLQFNRFFKQYGAARPLPVTDLTINDLSRGAYAEIAAHAGGGQANATIVGLQYTKIKTATADHDSVRFFATSDAAGTGFGTHGRIKNRTAYIIDLYPPNDGSQIYVGNTGQGLNTPIHLNPGQSVDWFTEADPTNALANVGNWNVD